MRREELAAAWNALPSPRPSLTEAAELIGTSMTALATGLSRCRQSGIYVAPRVDTDELLDEWAFLRDGGEHWERAAPRLGLTVESFAEILSQAHRRGDPRGNT